MTPYTNLSTLEDLNKALQLSETIPVLIFKHSDSCGISARAFKQFEKYLESDESAKVNNTVVTVQTSRKVSDEISRIMNVRHETPQVLIISKQIAVWHESHLAIKSDFLINAVQAVSKTL